MVYLGTTSSILIVRPKHQFTKRRESFLQSKNPNRVPFPSTNRQFENRAIGALLSQSLTHFKIKNFFERDSRFFNKKSHKNTQCVIYQLNTSNDDYVQLDSTKWMRLSSIKRTVSQSTVPRSYPFVNVFPLYYQPHNYAIHSRSMRGIPYTSWYNFHSLLPQTTLQVSSPLNVGFNDSSYSSLPPSHVILQKLPLAYQYRGSTASK